MDQLELDHCDECGGLWLDQSELPRLIELKPSALKPLARGRPRAGADQTRGQCPRCRSAMLRVASAHQRRVTLDKCPDCDGVWLDGGELQVLTRDAE